MVAGGLKTCGYRTSALSGLARSSMLQAAGGLTRGQFAWTGQVRAGRCDSPAPARDSNNDKNNDKNNESAL